MIYRRRLPQKLAPRSSIVGWAKCFFCPPVGAGGQQKDVAHPTKKLRRQKLVNEKMG